MGSMKLDDITVSPLQRIKVIGGDVLHIVKNTDPGFQTFGEAYFSEVKFGAVKAWKLHKQMQMNLIVPIGTVKFVFSINLKNDYRIEVIGENNYNRITVPPGIWFGFKGLTQPSSLVLNVSNVLYSKDEIDQIPADSISYNWATENTSS
jgi:dTDP-4-dehydrorhamnose 3,5-epimerase